MAEKSDFKSTATSAQVIDFIDGCETAASHVSKFEFGRTVEDRAMVAVAISTGPYEPGIQDQRTVALIIGNIHSGECAGKEALLMMIRELAHNPNHPWLEEMVLIFVPNYNADANDRMGKNNRPGQIGPENGMGRRENAQNLDLNRDFMKLESPEARALVKLIDQTNPHLFIDCHTTNGSKHQYALTYDIPHNPATAQPIRDYLRNKMMPAVTQRLSKKGTQTFFYGNFNREHTSWMTFGHEPRYSTEYVGLRGRMAILSEAYSYISYKDRIFATRDFVSECLDFVRENSNDVRKIVNGVETDLERIANRQPSRISVSLNARAEKFDQKFVLKGFKDEKPHNYECDFIGNYVSTRSAPLPYAYLVPARFARVIDRLLMHGIRVERLRQGTQCVVTAETIKELNRNERVFQQHRMLQAQTQRATENRSIPNGTYVVPTSQPLGRLAAYMLECESDDGLVFWNFFDRDLNVENEYPILRVDQPVQLDTERVSKVDVNKTGRISLDMIGGPHSILKNDPTPKWTGDGQLQIEIGGRKALMNARTMSFSQAIPTTVDVDELKALLIEAGVSEDQANSISGVTPIESDSRKWLIFDTKKSDVVYDCESQKIHLVGDEVSDAELFSFSPDQTMLAFVNRNGLNIVDLATFTTITLAAENPETELLGKLDWVYQEELYGRGNFKGYWFSPDSKTIAFLKLDESDVASFTITDHIPVRGENEFLNYPKAGDSNPTVAVGMASTSSSGDVSWTDLTKYKDQHILVSNVSWRPDSTQLILQIQNRQQTYLDFVAVDTMDTQANVLFQDKTPAWIESPGEPRWLSDGSFLWLSPRDGYKHLYHYAANGNLKKQITSGNWEIRSLVDFDQENGLVYFLAAKESPFHVNAYRLEVSNGSLTKLTLDPGIHNISFNHAQTMFIDSYSSATHPTRHKLYLSDGTMLRCLNVSSDDQWKYVGICKPEFLQLQTQNDQPMDAMVIKPPDFDPNKKYPVLIHTYAGPQAPQVRNRFGKSWALWHQLLAQNGYVIWKCDNQSASFRSAKHAWPIHRDLGRNELKDIEHGVEWLKRQTWVDADRIGIWGWSYGGYMTAYALTHSESFKIGIAGAPVTDWRNYDTIYTERLMGLPQENQKGYDASSVVKSAGDLYGKLLLIHGTIDDNVHLSNTMQLVFELQKAGKQFELMVYPKSRHAVQDADQAAHLRQLMFNFIVENL